ncbi:MAG: hypothetical protein ACFFFB_03765 [Candidatus Heimdallarchaeota archaeon]
MKEKSNGIEEKIWDIRVYIQKVEDIKDDIINYLNSLKKLDDPTRNIWISDVKEFYFNLVSSWEMLRTGTVRELNKKNIDNSKSFLYAAQNRLSQIRSQLAIFDSKLSSTLIVKAEISFEECWKTFWIIYKMVLPDKDLVKPKKIVIKVSDLEYHLPCSVCSKIAVGFKVGYGRLDEKESLVYRGITLETSLDVKFADKLFPILEEESLLGIHNFMKKHHSLEGIDGYCPECDKIYCWEHYNAREEYDDGFYDATYGECPKGHKRMIDD